MTIDKVIELGEKAKVTIEFDWLSAPWWVWIIVGLCSLVIIAVIHGVLTGADTEGIGAILPIIGVTFMIYMFFIDKETYDGVSAWEKDIAIPYIESLPVEKKEVVYIKIDPELSHETTGYYLFGNGYTTSKEIQKTPLTVSYKDNGVVTRTDWYQTKMELTEEEKPYIEYQELKKDLGHDIYAGMYNVKVYLPKSYEFTDIK